MFVFQGGGFFRRKIETKRYTATEMTPSWSKNHTNGTIPKKPSKMRAIRANRYANTFFGVILAFFSWFFLPEGVDLFFSHFLFEFYDLFSEVIFS